MVRGASGIEGRSYSNREKLRRVQSQLATSGEPLRGLDPAPFFPLQVAVRNPLRNELFRAARARTLTVYVNLNARRRYVVATSGQTIARHN